MKETIGQRLKKARQYRHLTLEKAEEVTRIRIQYLQALEADDFSSMPSPVQARGFLRNYAEYLGLDIDQIIAEMRSDDSQTEHEIYFEGQQDTLAETGQSPASDLDQRVPASESFVKRWLNRDEQTTEEVETKEDEPPDSPASTTNAEPAPAKDEETVPEPVAAPDVPVDSPNPWGSVVDRVRSLFARDRIPAAQEVQQEVEPEPEPEPVVERDEPPVGTSDVIFKEIGNQLRQRRSILSLSLDEIERHTRLRAHFLGLLEAGKMEDLPSPVQTRGMLVNYAQFLDLDADVLLLRFADGLQARHRERHPEKPARRRGQPRIPSKVPPLRAFIAGDLLFGVGMVAILIGFTIWGITRVIAVQSQEAAEDAAATSAPSISEALIGTQDVTLVVEATPIPVVDTPIPGSPEATLELPTQAANVNVQVNIVAVERTYLRVTVDGEVEYEGRTVPGNAYLFQAEQQIEILAGSGAALRVVYNQRDFGLLGSFGQVVNLIYTIDEILTPTVTAFPTATNTIPVTPSRTPTLTPTLTPTRTPTPSSNQ